MADQTVAAPADAAHLRRQPLGLRLMSLYGVGAITDAVMQAALANFLFFYLTIACGLSNSLAGLSLFVALCVDALVDPLVGSISDSSASRWGRRHPFMLAGLAPLALGLGLLFSVPKGLGQAWLFAYVTGVSILLRFAHSVFFLPYVGLGAELSDDYAERTNVVAARFLIGVVGTGAGLALGFGVFVRGAAKFDHDAYIPFGWACGAVAVAAGLVCIFGTLRALPRLHRVAPRRDSVAMRFFRDMAEIFSNRSFVILFLSLLMLFIGAGVAATLALHALTFFWRVPTWTIAAVSYAAPVGLIFGIPVSVFLSNRFEKRSVVIGCFIALIAYHATSAPMRIFGLLPAAGPVTYGFLIGMGLVVGAVVGCAGISFHSMMADAADEHESLFGTRREGLYFAGLNFSAKAASGVGALLAGLLLSLVRFPTDLAAHGGAAVRIPEAVATNLGLIHGPVVALIYTVGALIFLGYRLDRPAYAKIQALLHMRRAAAAAAAE